MHRERTSKISQARAKKQMAQKEVSTDPSKSESLIKSKIVLQYSALKEFQRGKDGQKLQYNIPGLNTGN